MSAEELDKLFKDKLANRPVTPSADAWARLQTQMQPQEEKKERKPFMWIYATAASVALLMGAGIWTLKDGDLLSSQPNATVATVQPSATPNRTNTQVISETPATVESEVAPQIAAVEPVEKNSDKKYQPQATTLASTASNHQTPHTTVEREQNMKASAPVTSLPLERMPEPTITLASNTAAEEAPLEIIVKLDNAQASQAVAQADTEAEPEQEGRKAGRIMKGLFKQVKNLKEGERVNLSELGITKHTFALETRIGNKKITKTINL